MPATKTPTSPISLPICAQCRRCNEAIAKQPVPRPARGLYSGGLIAKASGVLAGMTDTVTKPKTKVKTKTDRPRLHKLILLNDDFTPRDSVPTSHNPEFHITQTHPHTPIIP